jgi:hypothetical protein
MQDVLQVFAIFALLIGLFLVTLWAINDARRRGKSPILVWITVVLFFPYGLLAWLLFRPAPVVTRLSFSPRRPVANF